MSIFEPPESKELNVLEHLCIPTTEDIAVNAIEMIEKDMQIWPEETEFGLGFYAALGALWEKTEVVPKTEVILLREIVDTDFLGDESEKGRERCETLAKELKALATELIDYANR